MLTLSAVATHAKNSLYDDGAFLLLLKVDMHGDVLYLAKNTEDVTWNGHTWSAFSIVVGDIKDDPRGELPSIDVSVSNINRQVQNYVEQDENFGSGWNVTIYVVRSDNLSNSTPELEFSFVVSQVAANENFVTFTLGVPSPLKRIVPSRRVVPFYCQAIFKDSTTGCTYNGADTTCAKTLEACEAKFSDAESLPFLAFPSMPNAVLRKGE